MMPSMRKVVLILMRQQCKQWCQQRSAYKWVLANEMLGGGGGGGQPCKGRASHQCGVETRTSPGLGATRIEFRLYLCYLNCKDVGTGDSDHWSSCNKYHYCICKLSLEKGTVMAKKTIIILINLPLFGILYFILLNVLVLTATSAGLRG